MRIGLVGLGRMGTAILPHLIGESNCVTVWNRTPTKLVEARALGVEVARTPRELTDNADIILSLLFDDAAVDEVYLGTNGLLLGDCSGRLFVEMSTIRLDTLQELAPTIRARGGSLIDAPVSGSVGPAREGRLLALVGGAEMDVERATPVLSRFARRIVHLGALGSGMVLKLGIQEVIYVYWQALAEALALGEQKGLSVETMLDVIADSPAAIGALKAKIPAITGVDKEVSFSLAAAMKDLKVILTAGHFLDVHHPMAVEAAKCYEAAIAGGLANRDIAAIARCPVADRS